MPDGVGAGRPVRGDSEAARRRRASARVRATIAHFLRSTMADRVVRRPVAANARVRIFGLLEARLQHVDRVVLGGLVEGVWPPQTRSRPVAQPADAPAARPRPAGAADRADGARLCAGLGRPRGDPEPRRQDRRHADGRLALPAAARRRSAGESALERGARPRRALCRAWRASSTGRRRPPRIKPPAPTPAARRAAGAAERHRDRALAARSLHDLRQARARLARFDPVDTPPGARDRGTVIHAAIGDFSQAFASRIAGRSAGGTVGLRATMFRAVGRLPGGPGVLVAALRAHCALVCGLGNGASAEIYRRSTPRSVVKSKSRPAIERSG